MSNQSAAEAAFDALGDPQRRHIVSELRAGELPVGELADRLTIGRPAVSKHLKVLQGAGLVTSRSAGTRNLYSLAPEALVPLQQWLVLNWDLTLSALAEHIETRPKPPQSQQLPRNSHDTASRPSADHPAGGPHRSI